MGEIDIMIKRVVTLEEIKQQYPQLSEPEIRAVIQSMVEQGLIEYTDSNSYRVTAHGYQVYQQIQQRAKPRGISIGSILSTAILFWFVFTALNYILDYIRN